MDLKNLLGKLSQGISIADAILNSEGKFDPRIVLAGFLDRRISTVESFEHSNDYFLMPSYRDFPNLAKREIVTFPSGKNKLTGYIYRSELPKGVVIVVHGYNALADNCMAQFSSLFLASGYDVFAIDLTACGRSEGHHLDGMYQAALDVVEAENYLLSRKEFSHLPFFLFGHSWGAYGCLASLNVSSLPLAVFSFAGFSTPIDIMLGTVSGKIGPLSKMNREGLDEALKERNEKYWNLSAIDGINNSAKTNVYLFHGEKDKTVPYKKFSVVGNSFQSNNVKQAILKDRDHNNLFYDDDSVKYFSDVLKNMKTALEGEKQIFKARKDLKEEFLNSFDRMKCCQLNKEIFSYILKEMDYLSSTRIIDLK